MTERHNQKDYHCPETIDIEVYLAEKTGPCDHGTLAAALAYAEHGWAVFPCNGKQPLTKHGCKDATTDPEALRRLWQRFPPPNIGLATGKASGIWVLDVDGPAGEATLAGFEARHGPLPHTVMARTGGGGRHLLFRYNGESIKNRARDLGDGLDVRATGGYIIAPPSVHPDTGAIYQWDAESDPTSIAIADAPIWLLELVCGKNRRQRERSYDHGKRTMGGDGSSAGSLGGRYAEVALQDESRAVAQTASGGRNDRLNKAAFNLGQLVGGGELERSRVERRLVTAAEQCGLIADDGLPSVEATIKSGLEDGISAPRTRPDGHQRDGTNRKPNGAGGAAATASDGEQPADEWLDPDLSAARQNRRAPPALPLELFGPLWADWLATAAQGASCPVDYVAGPLLAAAAMLIGNARWISPWSGWKEPPVLWVATVGDPSSGKSPGADPVLDVLSTIETELAAGFEALHREWATARESARCAREAWEKDVKTAAKMGTPPPIMPASAVEPTEPVRARIKIADATPEALGQLVAAHEKGLLFFRDELAGWFGSFDKYGGTGSDRAFWLEAYGGRQFTIDRVKHPLPIIIPRLSVGVLGGVQPERLSDLLNSPDDGLQARFLWLWPDKVPPRRPTRNVNVAAATEAFRRLVELPLVPGDNDEMHPFVCTLADDAADAFDQWRREHSAVEVTGALGSAYGKAPGHLLRLALVLEHLWWCAPSTASTSLMSVPPSRITIQAVRAAAALIEDYFKPMAERVFSDASLPEADRLAATLARWILKERPKLVNARELRRRARLPGLREAAKIKLALGVLVEADWLRPAFDRCGDHGGRQREDYAVNPKLWEVHDA